jgi:hypothetical protein
MDSCSSWADGTGTPGPVSDVVRWDGTAWCYGPCAEGSAQRRFRLSAPASNTSATAAEPAGPDRPPT